MSELKDEVNILKGMTERLISFFKDKEIKEDEVKITLGAMKSKEGNINFEYQGEVLEAGVAIVAIAEDGSKIPVPVGDYELEDGSILVIEVEGIVASVGAVKEEESPAELDNAAPATSDVIGEVESAIKSIMIKYAEDNKAVTDALTTQITELKEQLVGLKKEVVEFGEKPAAVKLKSQPTAPVKLNSKGRILNKLRQN